MVQQKTGQDVHIPLHPELKALIDSLPLDKLIFLVTANGKHFVPAGFTNWFCAMADEGGFLDGLSLHGLRKSTAATGSKPEQILLKQSKRLYASL